VVRRAIYKFDGVETVVAIKEIVATER